MRQIISLTSIPPRFKYLPEVLKHLRDDHGRGVEIHLNLPTIYRRFPGLVPSLPPLPEGIKVNYCDHDYGPATKILGTLGILGRQNVSDMQLLFCDDDQVYPHGWACDLFRAQTKRPEEAITLCGALIDRNVTYNGRKSFVPSPKRFLSAYRAKRIKHQALHLIGFPKQQKPHRVRVETSGHADILMGYGGCVVRPSFFDARVFDLVEPYDMVDDIWLSGHLSLRNVPIWVPAGLEGPSGKGGERVFALSQSNFRGMDRKALDAAAIEYLKTNRGAWSRVGVSDALSTKVT